VTGLRSDQRDALAEIYRRAHADVAWPVLDNLQRELAATGSTLNIGRAIENLQHHYVRLDMGFSGPIELTLRAILEIAGRDAPELREFWNLVSFCQARYTDTSKPTKISTPEMMAVFGNDSARWRRAEMVIRSASWFLQKSGDFEWELSRVIIEFAGAGDIEGYIKAEAELRASVHGSYVDPTVTAPTASSTPVVELWQRPLPSGTDPEITDRVRRAQEGFARPGATVADHRDAVRDLADVLEMLRPRLTQAITAKDEAALFEIINKFAIRHANKSQQGDYDALWLFWMFHCFGATIYVVLWRLDDLAKSSDN
jgi:hypothetical protein